MKGFWKDKKVIVTGGSGFVGRALSAKLAGEGALVTAMDMAGTKVKKVKFTRINLTDKKSAMSKIKNADYVFHLAASVGSIEYNKKHNYDIYALNTAIDANVMSAVLKNRIKNLFLMSSAVVYPENAKSPISEDLFLTGIPAAANFGYAMAKIALETSGRLLCSQHGINVSVARPCNIYGPGDLFDESRGHFIPAIIRKVYSAKDGRIEVWGNGKQKRAFIYIDDLVNGIMLCAQFIKDGSPVNITSKRELSVKQVVNSIIKKSGREVRPVYNKKKAAGRRRTFLSGVRAKKILGFTAKVDFEDGIEKTILDYLRRAI